MDIVNKLGHCTYYHAVEAIETQIATEVAARNTALPDGMVPQPNLSTCLAWDNYDENVETLSGKGTLHDTVGICYQNISETDDLPGTHQNICEYVPVDFTKRSFRGVPMQLEPYRI